MRTETVIKAGRSSVTFLSGGRVRISSYKSCVWCGDVFNTDSDRARLRSRSIVFRRPMCSNVKDGNGKYRVYRVNGALCLRCRNIPRANVSDEFENNEPIMEGSATSFYPSGNYRLVVSEPGVSETVKDI